MTQFKAEPQLRRSFGGKIDNFTNKLERAFEQRHLKAYLKGKQYFRFGFNAMGDPNWFKVNEIWTPVI